MCERKVQFNFNYEKARATCKDKIIFPNRLNLAQMYIGIYPTAYIFLIRKTTYISKTCLNGKTFEHYMVTEHWNLILLTVGEQPPILSPRREESH